LEKGAVVVSTIRCIKWLLGGDGTG
jgi:hypothetical protein